MRDVRTLARFAAPNPQDGRRVKASKHAGVIKSVVVVGGGGGVDDVDLSMRFSHDYRVVERKRK